MSEETVTSPERDLTEKPDRDYLMKYDRLVMKIAIQYGADPRHVRDSWQYAEGWVGLAGAAARDRELAASRSLVFTYAHKYITGTILSHYRRHVKKKLDEAHVENMDQLPQNGRPEFYEEDYHWCLRQINCLRNLERTVMTLGYVQGLNDYEIGRVMGITRQYVSSLMQQGLQKIRSRAGGEVLKFNRRSKH